VLARLRTLARNLAIYGLGDVATNIVSFLLLPLYVHFLTPADYGAIALLYSVEVVAKILFRWGIDASFMRFWYDCETDRDRQRLASTVFWFLFVANGLVLGVALAAAPLITTRVFGLPGYELPLRLVLVNTFVIGFYFLPFHVLRIGERSTQFAMLTTSRAVATLVARFALIVGFELGVLGFVLADIVVTAIFTLVLVRWFAPLVRPLFSRAMLMECLRFGLPRVPHGMAQQMTAVSDRYFLAQFSGLSAVGLYSVGSSFGQAMKLFMSAFEYAWAPFYFATMKEPDAKTTFRTVTTYGVAVLVLLEAGLAAVSTDVVRLMTKPEFESAAYVIPWIGLGLVFHGVYLLTSIGLNITKQTRFYPAATGAAACASLVGNIALVPSFGAQGAAWTNAAAYGVLATVAFVLSQRVYPIPLEWGRLARLALAGTGAWFAASLLPATLAPLWGLIARGALVCAAYPALLLALGFYDGRELRTVGRLVARARTRRTNVPDAPAALDGPIEAGGAILEVPLVQDDLLEDEIVRRDSGADRSSPDRSSADRSGSAAARPREEPGR
jgi:O-antigen/teichoic acid export membrane protein